jgi:hypothetical protein
MTRAQRCSKRLPKRVEATGGRILKKSVSISNGNQNANGISIRTKPGLTGDLRPWLEERVAPWAEIRDEKNRQAIRRGAGLLSQASFCPGLEERTL